jgi:excinuclease UvrABC ATPase subunit
VGVLYVLDEPSIGLHQRDNRRLIETLTRLRDLGNTLIVVEHDEDTIHEADWVVDIGPGAGEHGGQVVHSGSYKELLENTDSLTGTTCPAAERSMSPRSAASTTKSASSRLSAPGRTTSTTLMRPSRWASSPR